LNQLVKEATSDHKAGGCFRINSPKLYPDVRLMYFGCLTKVNVGELFLQIMVEGNNEGNNVESKEDWDCEQEEFTK
jgi:hypothetical protein